MKRLPHSKPYRATQIALALLVALAAAAAAEQSPQAPQSQPQPQAGQDLLTPRQPAPATGPSYGPVLHPQTTKSEPGAQPEQTPQAQEEKAGGTQQQLPHREADPSARPAPQPQDPAQTDAGSKKQQPAPARRPVTQRIERLPQVQPAPGTVIATPPVQPGGVRPAPAQLNSCLGNTCTDTAGTRYQGGVGNASVSSEGRLCTTNGNTVQCF